MGVKPPTYNSMQAIAAGSVGSETFDTIRKICLEIVIEYVKPKNKVQEFFKRLLPKLTNTWFGQIIIKSFHKRISVNSNNEGFKANVITDKVETFGLHKDKCRDYLLIGYMTDVTKEARILFRLLKGTEEIL